MPLQSEVLLLTNEFETEGIIAAAIKKEDRLVSTGACRDLASLVNRLEENTIPLVLIDCDSEPIQKLDQIEPIINRFPTSRFVVLSSELGKELALKAMQAGVRHIQMKKTIESELGTVLLRLIPSTSAQTDHFGSVLTVFSAGGGCGSTTLVVNLANELQLATDESILLIDLDYIYGSVATYLELRGQYGIADVLAHGGGIDPQLITSTAVHHSEKLHALMSPASINFSEIKPLHQIDRLAAALAACKQAYNFTLIDAPRVSIDVAALLAGASETNWIVLQPMVKDIRFAKAMMDALSERGIAASRIKPVLTRYSKRHQTITLQDTKKALGGMPLWQLSNDHSTVVRCINYGKPLADVAPRSALRRDVARLAAEISKSNGHLKRKKT